MSLRARRRVEQQPWGFDFYQALRRIETLHAAKPRLGRAPRPIDEPVRLAQEPSLAFPISALSAFEAAKGNRPPRLFVRFFGLLGPNGPLPLHLTEFVRERILHERDRTFARFLDSVDGWMFVFLVLTVAAAEVVVGLAIIVAIFRSRHSINVDELNTLRG